MVGEIIKEALEKTTGLDHVELSVPTQISHGDYTTNVAMKLQSEGKTAREAAEKLVVELKGNSDFMKVVEKTEIAGPGFINFFVNPQAFKDTIQTIILKKHDFGKLIERMGERIIVEYSSPNIAKPFTIGHLRSTIIGDSVANLLENAGASVYRDNHLGDWGTQFGKQIYAIKAWGDEEAIEASASPVKELVRLYVQFHEEAEKNPQIEDDARAWFKKLEDHDAEALRLWQKCIDWSWKEFREIYEKLGIHFTENQGKGYGESFFEDKMQTVIQELENKKLLHEGEEGAKIVSFENEKYPPMMIVKKDGTSLYATRDLAADKFRLQEYGKDTTIINEVGAEQTLHFHQLFELEKLLGWVRPGQRIHIKHGLFRFKDKKMSTRKGNVIWLEEVLQEAYEKARALAADNLEATDQISVGALKWNELKRDPISDIIFDWDEILNMKGNSGPYMQYTVVRIKSVLAKSDVKPTKLSQISPESLEIARKLSHFEEVCLLASQKFHSSYVCEYLFDLAQSFNSFYDAHKIIGSENEAEYIALLHATAIVLENGLNLLGITVPDKM